MACGYWTQLTGEWLMNKEAPLLICLLGEKVRGGVHRHLPISHTPIPSLGKGLNPSSPSPTVWTGSLSSLHLSVLMRIQ